MTATCERITASPLSTLLVDDEEAFGEGFVSLLGDYGFDADFVTTAERAEPLTEDHDVVVVDLNLPDMSGKELAQRIQERHPAKWILLVTARNVLKEEMEQSDSVRYDGLFDKPLLGESLQKFRHTLERLRERKESTADLLNLILAELDHAENSRVSLLERQESFVKAKKLIRGEVQDRFRGRSTARRHIALMLRAAIDRLSLFPSQEFSFIEPKAEHFTVLKDTVLRLGKEKISSDDDVATDQALEAVGLTTRLEVRDPSIFFDI